MFLLKHLQDMKVKANALEVSIDKYMARYEPEFCAMAFGDLVGLPEFVKMFVNKEGALK